MSFKAVVFDLDGTLLDSLEDIGLAANRVLSGRGLPTHPIDAYRTLVGDGVAKLIARALPADRQDPQLVQDCINEYRQDYGRNWNVHTCPYDGVPQMLDALRERGLKLAVLSNKPDEFTQLCVASYLGSSRFEAVWGERQGVPRKPHPTGAMGIARVLGVEPAQFLYVGDSAVDMQTALAAGMFPVGALWGFRSRQELEASGAKSLVGQPLDMLGLLNGNPAGHGA